MDLVQDILLGLIVVVAALIYFIFASFIFGAGYQPTNRRVVDRMMTEARVVPSDKLYDLGAGTGAIVFVAARKYGAFVVGVEVDPIRMLDPPRPPGPGKGPGPYRAEMGKSLRSGVPGRDRRDRVPMARRHGKASGLVRAPATRRRPGREPLAPGARVEVGLLRCGDPCVPLPLGRFGRGRALNGTRSTGDSGTRDRRPSRRRRE